MSIRPAAACFTKRLSPTRTQKGPARSLAIFARWSQASLSTRQPDLWSTGRWDLSHHRNPRPNPAIGAVAQWLVKAGAAKAKGKHTEKKGDGGRNRELARVSLGLFQYGCNSILVLVIVTLRTASLRIWLGSIACTSRRRGECRLTGHFLSIVLLPTGIRFAARLSRCAGAAKVD
jgi:hypothetical protein